MMMMMMMSSNTLVMMKDVALRFAWRAACLAPLWYVTTEHIVDVVEFRPRGEAGEYRLVLGRALFPLLRLFGWEPRSGDSVRFKSTTVLHEARWAVLVGEAGSIVQTHAGLTEFITRPKLWLELDSGCDQPDDVDCDSFGPVHSRLCCGVSRAVVWPPARARVLPPPTAPHSRNLGSEIEIDGVRLRNFDDRS
jgi:hypothetical protein